MCAHIIIAMKYIREYLAFNKDSQIYNFKNCWSTAKKIFVGIELEIIFKGYIKI